MFLILSNRSVGPFWFASVPACLDAPGWLAFFAPNPHHVNLRLFPFSTLRSSSRLSNVDDATTILI